MILLSFYDNSIQNYKNLIKTEFLVLLYPDSYPILLHQMPNWMTGGIKLKKKLIFSYTVELWLELSKNYSNIICQSIKIIFENLKVVAYLKSLPCPLLALN